jgi:hypothetical protein
MSRQFKAYASAYQVRDHESQLSKGDVQRYACDLNGALNGETIASATWGSTSSCVTLSGLAVADGIATVNANAVNWGGAILTLHATTNTGRKLSQRFLVGVRGECAPTATVSWP